MTTTACTMKGRDRM